VLVPKGDSGIQELPLESNPLLPAPLLPRYWLALATLAPRLQQLILLQTPRLLQTRHTWMEFTNNSRYLSLGLNCNAALGPRRALVSVAVARLSEQDTHNPTPVPPVPSRSSLFSHLPPNTTPPHRGREGQTRSWYRVANII
jgi:hypothetical protein